MCITDLSRTALGRVNIVCVGRVGYTVHIGRGGNTATQCALGEVGSIEKGGFMVCIRKGACMHCI